MDISKNIKAVREERKISQSEIARRLGVEPTNYPRMEKRGDKLTVEQLGRIAGALGVSVLELLTGEPQTVQSDERVNELEKRVNELEDRVRDKERIIGNFEYVQGEILDTIESYITESIYSFASDRKIGKMTVIYDSGKEVSMTFEEYEKGYEFEKEGFSTLHTLSQSEEQYFFNLLVENDEHDFFEFFFRRGLIDDKDLLRLYDGYLEGVIGSVGKRKGRKAQKG